MNSLWQKSTSFEEFVDLAIQEGLDPRVLLWNVLIMLRDVVDRNRPSMLHGLMDAVEFRTRSMESWDDLKIWLHEQRTKERNSNPLADLLRHLSDSDREE